MNAADKQNAPRMESTSRSEPTAGPTLAESQLLDRQVVEAKQAVLRTLEDVKANLGTASDLRLWTQRYPWLAVGVAAATGFAAASLVTPARGQSLQDKIDELTSAQRDKVETGETDHATTAAAAKASTRSAIATTIFGSLFEILRMVVTNFAANAMRPPVATSASRNGHGDDYAGPVGRTPNDTADGESA